MEQIIFVKQNESYIKKFPNETQRSSNFWMIFVDMVVLWVLWLAACSKNPGGASPVSIAPANMPRISTVDERFQSYNVEMIEVTGGTSSTFRGPYFSVG